ncbi:IclR family transcriptional regulator [Janibacter hoylei]|uniref:IclR family transcriptional regulator n=1 Tax=Janibacter hoylei TaxID=364298 RepID=UPI0024926E80|nr:IclR family transcriptional regulator [Janibacter hoylei]
MIGITCQGGVQRLVAKASGMSHMKGFAGVTTNELPGKAAGSSVRSVQTALRLLDALAEHSPCGVGELARRLGVPKSTAHRGLQTLEAAGWASVDDHGRYSVTAHLLSLGLMASRESGLHEAAFPEMEKLRDQTGETIHLTVRDNQAAVLVLRAEGTHHVRTMLPLGTRVPLYASSSGHAILASLPDEEVEGILAAIDKGGRSSSMGRSEVWRSVRSAREVGYTVRTQSRQGVVGIGSLITSQVTPDRAAITVSFPIQRKDRWSEEELGPLVRQAAQRASRSWRTSS